jgi:hypothetical protein
MAELSPALSRRLKGNIAAEKARKEAEAPAKVKVSGERQTGQTSGLQNDFIGEISVSNMTSKLQHVRQSQ